MHCLYNYARQTVYHQPAPETLYGRLVSSTLQLGDPSIIANECGVRVVGDFRMADIGVGGQGAPLVPYLDRMLLERHCRERGRVGLLLNVGGISNISAFVPGGVSPTQMKIIVRVYCMFQRCLDSVQVMQDSLALIVDQVSMLSLYCRSRMWQHCLSQFYRKCSHRCTGEVVVWERI